MNFNVGTKISVGYALALVFLIVIGIIAYQNIASLVNLTTSISDTQTGLTDLERIVADMSDAETSTRGFVIVGDEEYLGPYNRVTARISHDIKLLKTSLSNDPEQQTKLQDLERLIADKMKVMDEMIRLRKEEGREAAVKLVMTGKGNEIMEEIRVTATSIRESEEADLSNQKEIARKNAETAEVIIVLGTILAFIILSVFGIGITRNISRPLKEMTVVAGKIASGDLTIEVSPNGRSDEVGHLSRAFTTMIENLRLQTREILESVNILASSANEISTATAQLASSVAETASAVSETTTTVEEVRQTAQHSSQKARNVMDTAQRTLQVSQSGKKSTREVIAGMTIIREKMDSIANTIMKLSEQSQAVGEIIATVNDLAEQSNLLAVNASIEAAKAGEHGRGFTVVAHEIRNLAEQSKEATTQVRTILSDIQKAVGAAVMATEQGSKAVDAGVKQVSDAEESIGALAESVAEAAQTATQIAASSQQQLVGVDQVASAMESIKIASTQNVEGTNQTKIVADNLHELGQKLKHIAERYRA